ncbi:MAG: nucleotidyltransferase [Hydrogenophilales bacterium CG17_big_fil_post_rev_8_21_14_2_50_63_12]|nr:MAG: nucleotidyltransferase [Hydrogenophilales bacterium CG17_big_fil_post_rev_8_21_14_2_50_63_12]PIX96998.1 MAG: nucleotidyltransferase [Hydrogenophilales bacterium CG_4_10_14_3_um_filter_63_21]PJB02302.1 MAG: nucleotidyltransferase [Hydrogenophilales bacterium CG_4_9_14_3_um_filter_63_34]
MAAAHDVRALQVRAQVAELAARLMAEHGLRDYAVAKRKAARQLGLPEGYGMPSNEEIDAAQAERQALFQPDEQASRLTDMREQAREVMRVFGRFAPALTGAVASGVVSEHSLIELEIAQDASKDFEQFLVNREIAYKVQDRADRMAYLIYSEPADVLVHMVARDIRHAHAQRLSLERLEKLLTEARP